MTTGNALPADDVAWRPHEAQVLAALLRTTRLTVLYGASGPAMTALLRSGVLPLLRSGPGEWVLDERRVAQVVIPFPDRRVAERAAAGPSREVVVEFDAWNEAPLPALAARLGEALPWPTQDLELTNSASLAERLALLHERLGARFLFVFDRFEDFLDAPRDREDLRAFSHAFVEAVNQPGLAANFLIALREEAKPLLKRLRRRIPSLAQHGLRLSSRDDGRLDLLPVLEQDADLRPGSMAPDSSHPAMNTQDVYASIEALLAKTAEASHAAPWQGPPGEPAPEAADSDMPAVWHDSRSPPPPSPEPMHEAPPPLAPVPVRAAPPAWRTYAIAAAVMLPLLLAAWMLGEQAGRQPAVALDAESTAATRRFVLTMERDASTDARVAAELAHQLASRGGVELSAAGASEGAAAWRELAGPRLAILRADALQAARDGGPGLRIVGPLFAEEVHVLVRADSPLKSVQQLKGKRINVGPATGARARTATRLYEALFGARLPTSAAGALPLDAALRQLLERKGLDAMIVIDAQPSAWLAAQSPEARRAIRLLKLGDTPAASRKPLQGWLPATLRDDAYAGLAMQEATPTLAQMSYLVTSSAYDDADPSAMEQVALALCRALPALRRDGHPKWLEVQPGWQEETGWPYSPSAVRGFRACLGQPADKR